MARKNAASEIARGLPGHAPRRLACAVLEAAAAAPPAETARARPPSSVAMQPNSPRLTSPPRKRRPETRIGARERQHDEPPHTHGSHKKRGAAARKHQNTQVTKNADIKATIDAMNPNCPRYQAHATLHYNMGSNEDEREKVHGV